MIITLDGTAGSGKSTAAQDLAKALGFELLNTGAMYRATGFLLLRQGIDIFQPTPDLELIEKVIADWTFEVSPTTIQVNGEELTSVIVGERMGQAASKVGTFKPVRRKLQAEQRRIANGRDVICEGRDQGSVVFPDARVKFYFTATAEVRASRRISGDPATETYQQEWHELVVQLRARDLQDQNRDLDPLVIPVGAVQIDTTSQDRDAVLQLMLSVVAQCRSPLPSTT
jgi:CMP/dCMP kinase